MLKRIFAIAVIVILVGLYVATFIMGITGSQYIAGMLFLCVAVPVLFWAISLVTKLLRMKGVEIQQECEFSEENTEEKDIVR
jgi:Ca2+/Na+ antiporter